ncbi:MAG: Gldg family protein [Bacteroidetes bacterium]|nr:Gldg family protein [Bacteroidota bacterium]
MILVSVNIIGNFLFFRIDLTAEKRYSISDASRELAGSLNDVVYFKVYLDGELPPGFRRLRNATRELLDEFRIYAGGNIEYEFVDPSAEPEEKKRLELYKQLARKGLLPTNLEEREKGGSSQKIIFPGAIASFGGEEIPVQLLKSRLGSSPEEMLNTSVENLEYEIAGVLRRFTRTGGAPRIGFLRGHGELDNKHISDAARALNEYYNVDTVFIGGRLDALKDHRLLIIAKPTLSFDEKDKFVIDQFIMRGGRVLWLIDRMQAEMDSLGQTGTTVAIPYELNLDDQLFRYGARVNTDLVMDLQAAPIPVVTG